MTVSINGSTGLVFNDGTTQASAPKPGMVNRIINGAMMIDQRNAGASVTPTGTFYTLDRWLYGATQSSKASIQQNAGSVTRPAGFTNYLGITSLSAYSVLTGDVFAMQQYIEGFNVADLAWGTASASPITLSFWVRSSLTGTFGGSLANADNTRSYPFTYTISSANTWEYKTITIAGDTSGTWVTNNGVGLRLRFGLGCGSTYSGAAGAWAGAQYWSATGATSVVGTNGATFYITGVQLEKGSTATSFDYRPYGAELQLCQRYYEETGSGDGLVTFGGVATAVNNNAFFNYQFKANKRSTPTVTKVGTWATTNCNQPVVSGGSVGNAAFYNNAAAAGGFYVTNSNAGNKFTFEAEL